MANYNLTVRTLSPLHIGTGRELRLMFDYIIDPKKTARLNEDIILQKKYDERYPNRLPGAMISNDLQNPVYYRYIIQGRPRSIKEDSRLRECVKDVRDVPYIPGSSIKGAIRTAFGASLLKHSELTPDLLDLNAKGKYMDTPLEKALFGKEPREDLFRALRISDAVLPEGKRDPNSTMMVMNINPISWKKTDSSVPVEAECIKGSLDFSASVTIDEYLLREKKFPNSDLLRDELMTVIKRHSEERLAQLKDWYKNAAGAEKILGFLDQLETYSTENLKFVKNKAMMQMGFGTGWDGMTYSSWLKEDEIFFEDLYGQHLRRKQNRGKAPMREPGEPFPTSRKTVTKEEKPSHLLGWVLLILEPKR